MQVRILAITFQPPHQVSLSLNLLLHFLCLESRIPYLGSTDQKCMMDIHCVG